MSGNGATPEGRQGQSPGLSKVPGVTLPAGEDFRIHVAEPPSVLIQCSAKPGEFARGRGTTASDNALKILHEYPNSQAAGDIRRDVLEILKSGNHLSDARNSWAQDIINRRAEDLELKKTLQNWEDPELRQMALWFPVQSSQSRTASQEALRILKDAPDSKAAGEIRDTVRFVLKTGSKALESWADSILLNTTDRVLRQEILVAATSSTYQRTDTLVLAGALIARYAISDPLWGPSALNVAANPSVALAMRGMINELVKLAADQDPRVKSTAQTLLIESFQHGNILTQAHMATAAIPLADRDFKAKLYQSMLMKQAAELPERTTESMVTYIIKGCVPMHSLPVAQADIPLGLSLMKDSNVKPGVRTLLAQELSKHSVEKNDSNLSGALSAILRPMVDMTGEFQPLQIATLKEALKRVAPSQ